MQQYQSAQEIADAINTSSTITAFDWVVMIVVGLSALLALFRGFVREVLSLSAWVGAAIATLYLHDEVAALLQGYLSNKLAILGASTVGTYFVFLIGFSILSIMIMRFLQAGSDISILDSILGMLFGMARGLFIISLCYLILTTVMTKDEYPEWIANARLLPQVENTARWMAKLAPGYVNDISELSQNAKEKGEQVKQVNDTYQMLKEGNEKSGKKMSHEEQQKQLDKLLNTIAPEEVKK